MEYIGISAGLLLIVTLAIWLPMKRRVRSLPHHFGALSVKAANVTLVERAANNLALFIRCPTVSVTQSDGDYTAFNVALQLIRMLYPNCFQVMKSEVVNQYSLVLHWKGKDSTREPLLFCAHIDVVPAGDGWIHDPFGGVREGGFVHGRGTLDVKNVLICLLEAAEALIKDNFTPERDIYFAFGHDEEIGGENGAAVIAQRFANQNIRFAMVLDEGGFCIKQGDQYIAQVGVAEKGLMNLQLTCRDEGGHASIPTRQTALGRLAEAVSRIEACQPDAYLTPLTRDYFTATAATLNSKQRFRLANANALGTRFCSSMTASPTLNAMLRTTAAPTFARSGEAHNVLPRVAEANINVRILTGESGRQYQEYVARLTADLNVEIEVTRLTEPSNVSRYDDAVFRQLTDSIHDVFGPVTVAPYLMVGATDAAKYEPLCQHTYRFCPFVVSKSHHSTIHAADERIQDRALGSAVLFYQNLMTKVW